MPELQPRKKPTFPDLDYSKPVDIKAIEATASEADCFTYLWEPQDKACTLCNDNMICGIMFNSRQTKHITQHEKENGNYLDNIHFDSINKDDVMVWLKHKPRTLKQFNALIHKHSECPDLQTCQYWCRSFLREHKIKTVEGIITITD